MTTKVLHPPNEHLGFIKSEYGDTNLAKHYGFTSNYEAVYTKGTALVEALAVNYDETYSWRSASFFTGIDANLSDFLTPTKEVFSVVLAALDLISNVLTVLDTLLGRGINILKAIVDKVLSLLLEVLSILNPAVACHMLVIPPKVGKVVAKYPEIDDSDSLIVKSAKKSEQARMDFTRYVNDLHRKLPEALSSDLSKFTEVANNDVTGYKYLLNTIEAKLNDKTDMGRPSLKKYSKWEGVGIFIGSSAINQVLNAWESINSLFSKEVGLDKLKFKGLPAKPLIVENQIPRLNNIAISGAVLKDESYVTANAVVTRPLIPTFHTIKSGITYYFRTRIIFVYKISNTNVDTEAKLKAAITKKLSKEAYLQEALTAKDIPIDNLYPYSYLSIDVANGSEYYRVPDYQNKLEDGDYYLLAIDFYALDRLSSLDDPSNRHIFMLSDLSKFSCKSDPDTKTAEGVFSWRFPSPNLIDSSSKSPSWIAASTAVQFLPEATAAAHSFLVILVKSLGALLDDALNWVSVLLNNLKVLIEAYRLILQRIDAIIELLQSLLDITASIGASVIRFSGEGDTSTLTKVFKEYLDPSVSSSSKVSGTPSELDIRRSKVLAEEARLRSWAEAEKEKAVSELIVREDASSYDATGSVKLVSDTRKVMQDSELASIISGDQNVKDAAISVAYNSSYNMSPIFTPEMSTAGIILMGHDNIGGGLYAWRTLLDLLFDGEEPATQSNEADLLADKGLFVDLPDLVPDLQQVAAVEPAPLFTENMELTTDPNDSPFNFCPSDE